MAIYHFRSGGTKTGAAGASTPGDWSVANCYGVNENRWNDVKAQLADGDEIILYDENDGSTVTTHNFGSPNNSGQAAGSFTLKSRSGNPNFCVMTGDGTAAVIDFTEGTNTNNWTFENLTFSMESYTFTGSAFRFLLASGDTEFSNCILGPFSYTGGTPTGAAGGALINFNVAKDLTFTNTTVKQIAGTREDTPFIRHNGATGNVVIAGTSGLAFEDCTYTDATGEFRGCLYVPNAVDVSGTKISATNCTFTVSAANHNNWGVVYLDDGPSLTLNSLEGSNLTLTSTKGGGMLLSADNCDVTIESVVATNCRHTTDGSVNDPGGVLFGFTGGTWDIGSLDTSDCYATYGTALYWGSGCGGTVDVLKAVNNTCRESAAAVYNGGYADQTIKCLLASGCGHEGTPVSSDAHPSVMLSRLSTTGASAAKTTTIEKGIIINCTTGDASYPIVRVNQANTSYDHNVTLQNLSMHNEQGKVEIEYSESPSATLNLAVIDTKLPNGASDISPVSGSDISNGTKTLNNIIVGFSNQTIQLTCSDSVGGGLQRSSRSRVLGKVPYWEPWEEPQPKARKSSNSRDRLAELVGTMGMPRSKK